jgi:predicted RNase H-like nuclease
MERESGTSGSGKSTTAEAATAKELHGPRDSMNWTQTRASVLGIDAAWTPGNASGVALITKKAGRWHCVRVSDGYHSFANSDPSTNSACQRLHAEQPLSKCRELLDGDQPQVVALDMPIGIKPIVARRTADRKVSRRFGHAGCSTHSPTPTRPGEVSTDFVSQFAGAGFHCDFGRSTQGDNLIEVYPHVALLALAGSASRLPYKAQKTKKYWPQVSIEERRRKLLAEWGRILALLRRYIDGIDLEISRAAHTTFSALKPYEDQIDALVSACVGALRIEAKALAIGDDDSGDLGSNADPYTVRSPVQVVRYCPYCPYCRGYKKGSKNCPDCRYCRGPKS